MNSRRPLIAKISLAIFVSAAAGMIGNEFRLESHRPQAPRDGYDVPVRYKFNERMRVMYISRQDERGRAVLVVAFLGGLLVHAWAARLGVRGL